MVEKMFFKAPGFLFLTGAIEAIAVCMCERCTYLFEQWRGRGSNNAVVEE